MQLDTYIKQSIYSVMSGISTVDEILQNKRIGKIWKGNIVTSNEALVNVRLVKGTDPDNPNNKESVPVIIFDYQVLVEVADEQGEADSASIEVGAKCLKVFNMKGKVSGNSHHKESEKEGHTLKFSIPVGMT